MRETNRAGTAFPHPSVQGYYGLNFSVFLHDGQWCMRATFPGDLPATGEAKRAVEMWAAANRAKFRAGT